MQRVDGSGAIVDSQLVDPITGFRSLIVAQDLHCLPMDHPDACDMRRETGLSYDGRLVCSPLPVVGGRSYINVRSWQEEGIHSVGVDPLELW